MPEMPMPKGEESFTPSNSIACSKPLQYEQGRMERENSMESSYDRCSMKFLDTTNKSVSNVSTIFISPQKPRKEAMDRFVKIKQKVLNPGSDMSQDIEWSSFQTKQFESMATLSQDIDPSHIPTIPNDDSLSLGRASAFEVIKPQPDQAVTEMSVETFPPPKPAKSNMVNLENIIALEQKLWEMYEKISSQVSDLTLICEDWWEITQEETTLIDLGGLFREEVFRDYLKKASLCECIVVSIAYVISLHLETPPKSVLHILRTSAYYVHQNFLKMIELVIKRLPQESRENHWA